MKNVTDDEDCGVYCIMNLVNGKKYIGSSIAIRTRWSSHVRALSRGNHRNAHLQRSWDMHGGDSFLFYVLEHCDSNSLPVVETKFIQHFRSYDIDAGFNMTLDALMTSRSFTDATRQKISDSLKGRKVPDEVRQKISRTLTGRKKSAAAVKKGADAIRGRPMHPRTLEAITRYNTGLIRGASTRAKISNANRKISDAGIADFALLISNGVPLSVISSLAGVNPETCRSVLLGVHRAYASAPTIIRDACDRKLEMDLMRARNESASTTQEAA